MSIMQTVKRAMEKLGIGGKDSSKDSSAGK